MNATRPVVAAITAAGASRRMGAVKALLPWGESTLLGAIAHKLDEVELWPAIAICGAHRTDVAAEAHRQGLSVVANDSWQSGRFTSIQAAARCTIAHSVQASLLLWPVDCPGVQVDTIRALVDAASEDTPNVVPLFQERGGHPVLLGPAMIASILGAPGSSNLRTLLHAARRTTRRLPVDDEAVLGNLNSPSDYESKRPQSRKEAAG